MNIDLNQDLSYDLNPIIEHSNRKLKHEKHHYHNS